MFIGRYNVNVNNVPVTRKSAVSLTAAVESIKHIIIMHGWLYVSKLHEHLIYIYIYIYLCVHTKQLIGIVEIITIIINRSVEKGVRSLSTSGGHATDL